MAIALVLAVMSFRQPARRTYYGESFSLSVRVRVRSARALRLGILHVSCHTCGAHFRFDEDAGEDVRSYRALVASSLESPVQEAPPPLSQGLHKRCAVARRGKTARLLLEPKRVCAELHL
jgi:hypothetical protein